MRLALIGLVTLAGALLIAAQSGNAQESFFNERYCTRGTGSNPDSNGPDCSFHTWQQCIESARGSQRWCSENPFWRGPRGQPTTQGRSYRRNR
jgi:hypothetical protein